MKYKSYERNRRLVGAIQTHIKKIRRNSMSIDITKAKFNEYKTVQKSGMFNMFDPKAREMTTLTKDEWITIMQDYEKLNAAWGKNG
jgi:hypothetical protein|tara:strand:+ start:387 stop:644 length:258 start_codon:yes stop_codon:yes gene_type:complete